MLAVKREADIPRMIRFNVNAYPTLRLYKGGDGSFVEYPYSDDLSNLTEKDILSFLEQNGIKAGGSFDKA